MDKMPATINRFFPGTVEIKAGATVTWKSVSVIDPHTITFEPPFTNPEDPRAIPPAGAKAGGSYTAGFTNSGILGPRRPSPADTFSLRFPKKGSYNYVCGFTRDGGQHQRDLTGRLEAQLARGPGQPGPLLVPPACLDTETIIIVMMNWSIVCVLGRDLGTRRGESWARG